MLILCVNGDTLYYWDKFFSQHEYYHKILDLLKENGGEIVKGQHSDFNFELFLED